MADFNFHLNRLIDGLDPQTHATEIRALQRCRTLDQLHRLADDGGWLTPGSIDPRLKLVRHGSGTYLVVRYEDGWTTRLAMEPFPR